MAADHAIADVPALHARAARSPPRRRAPAASSPSACSRPRRRPATAISSAATRCATRPGAYAVAGFVEKPDAADGGAAGRRRPASVELRHVRVHRAHAAGGDGSARARRAGRRCGRRWTRAATDLDFIRLGRGGVRRLPVDQPGLRGGRAHQPRRGGAGRYRLVRRRKLERAVGTRRARTRPATSRSATCCWRTRRTATCAATAC